MEEAWPTAHVAELCLHSLPAQDQLNGDEHQPQSHRAVREQADNVTTDQFTLVSAVVVFRHFQSFLLLDIVLCPFSCNYILFSTFYAV